MNNVKLVVLYVVYDPIRPFYDLADWLGIVLGNSSPAKREPGYLLRPSSNSNNHAFGMDGES